MLLQICRSGVTRKRGKKSSDPENRGCVFPISIVGDVEMLMATSGENIMCRYEEKYWFLDRNEVSSRTSYCD